MLDPEEIDALVAKVLEGDREAYRPLVEAFEARIRAVLAAVGPDRAFVQDLCQEVFIEAYLHLNRYQIGTNFGAWLSQIARNIAKQEIRRRVREAKRTEKFGDELRLMASEANLDEATEENKDLLTMLRHCLERLPAAEMLLVKALYFQNTAPAILAEQLGRSLNWLRVTLHRIRRQLFLCMDNTVRT